MARKLRVEYPGAIYHVMNRGDHCGPIFQAHLARERKGEGCQVALAAKLRAETTASFEAAYRRAPNWIGNQVMLAEAQRRQQGLTMAQWVLLRQEMNGARAVNPLEPDPMRRMQNPWNHVQTPIPSFPPDPNPLSQHQNSTRTP